MNICFETSNYIWCLLIIYWAGKLKQLKIYNQVQTELNKIITLIGRSCLHLSSKIYLANEFLVYFHQTIYSWAFLACITEWLIECSKN